MRDPSSRALYVLCFGNPAQHRVLRIFGILCIFWSFMYIFGVLCIFYRGTNKAQEEKSIFPRPEELIQVVELGLKPKLTLKSKPT